MMKRLLLLLSLVVVAAMVTGCGWRNWGCWNRGAHCGGAYAPFSQGEAVPVYEGPTTIAPPATTVNPLPGPAGS